MLLVEKVRICICDIKFTSQSLTNLAIIIFLPFISQNSPNDRAGVFDHHLSSLNVPFTEKSPTMNWRSVEQREELTSEFDRGLSLFIVFVAIVTCKLQLLLSRSFPGV